MKESCAALAATAGDISLTKDELGCDLQLSPDDLGLNQHFIMLLLVVLRKVLYYYSVHNYRIILLRTIFSAVDSMNITPMF